MDALDVRILRQMGLVPYGRDPRPPLFLRPAEFARLVGASKERVRDRLAKMHSAGIIAGYQISPNYRHLGVESACYLYRFPDDDAVDAAVEKLQPLEGVLGCYGFMGGVLCVEIMYSSPATLERRLKVLLTVGGDVALEKFYDIDMPAVSRPLSNLDWRILQSLRGQADRSLAEVAKEVGASTRTVRRHFDRMAEEGSFFITPRFDPSRTQGAMTFYLSLYLDADADHTVRGRLHKAFEDSLLVSEVPSNPKMGNLTFMLLARSLGEVDDLRKKGLQVSGVARAETFLFRTVAGRGDWQDEIIAMQAGGGNDFVQGPSA